MPKNLSHYAVGDNGTLLYVSPISNINYEVWGLGQYGFTHGILAKRDWLLTRSIRIFLYN